MYLVGQYINYHQEELQTAIADWIIFIRLLTTPTTLQIDKEEVLPFDAQEVAKRIKELTDEEDFWWKIESAGGKFQIHVYHGAIFSRNIIDWDIFHKNEAMIADYFDSRMMQNGLYGYIRSYDEYLYSNVSRISERDFETAEETEKLPKMYNRKHNLIVDCNQFAGYDIFFKGLCLTSCWKMYFSKYYFRVIPKQIFDDVQQVTQINQLGNEMVQIILYSHPLNWDYEVNLNYQRLFRDQLGFDQLAWNNGVGILRQPYIEFAFGEDSVHTVQYQNMQGQPTMKKKASQFITRTYDFIHGKYDEHQLRGTLNAQAYFPWVDETGQKMMNYKVLNPALTIDNGLQAYEYYIREFLELDLGNDKNYQQFLPILRFYVPDEYVQKIPIDVIQAKLSDVAIKPVKNKNNAPTFDLKKGKNHLRIIFMDYNQLDFVHSVKQDN